MEFFDIKPSEVTFLRELTRRPRGQHSAIFLVTVRNITCVMKVYHDLTHRPWPRGIKKHDDNIYGLERTAYRRLMERGVCQKGYVPSYHGCVDCLDPTLWQSSLYMFNDDEYPPNASFIEYIPAIEPLELETATKERMDRFIEGLVAIHKAGIIHNDTYSRNMMVDPSKPDKVVWLDFDRALTFDVANLTHKQRAEFEDERDFLIAFKESVALDRVGGEIAESSIFW